MILAIVGGMLIGLSASLFWALNGRVAGVSGILSGALLGGGAERAVRLAFLVGLLIAGVGFALFSSRVGLSPLPLAPLAGAGLLVGLGTRMSGGCTSGHGVCGVSRLSRRSLAAVATFMASGALTVLLVRHVLKFWVQP